MPMIDPLAILLAAHLSKIGGQFSKRRLVSTVSRNRESDMAPTVLSFDDGFSGLSMRHGHAKAEGGRDPQVFHSMSHDVMGKRRPDCWRIGNATRAIWQRTSAWADPRRTSHLLADARPSRRLEPSGPTQMVRQLCCEQAAGFSDSQRSRRRLVC